VNFVYLPTVPRMTDALLRRIVAASDIRAPKVSAAWGGVYSDLATPSTHRVESRVSDL
jgi:hypothetical protein